MCLAEKSVAQSRGPLLFLLHAFLNELWWVSLWTMTLSKSLRYHEKFIKVENSRITRRIMKRRCNLYCACRNTVVIFFCAFILFLGSGSWQDNRHAGLCWLISLDTTSKSYTLDTTVPATFQKEPWMNSWSYLLGNKGTGSSLFLSRQLPTEKWRIS